MNISSLRSGRPDVERSLAALATLVGCSGCFAVDDFYILPHAHQTNGQAGASAQDPSAEIGSDTAMPDSEGVVAGQQPDLQGGASPASSIAVSDSASVATSLPSAAPESSTANSGPSAADPDSSPVAGGTDGVGASNPDDGEADEGADATDASAPAPNSSAAEPRDAGVDADTTEAGAVAVTPAPSECASAAGFGRPGACALACANDEQQGPSGRCYWFGPEALNFDAAQAACGAHAQGWQLVSVRSEPEDALIRAQLTTDSWIGASDAATANAWFWLDDGTEFWRGASNGRAVGGAYTNWGADEPSGSRGANCALYRDVSGDWSWAAADCREKHPPVCAGPEPADASGAGPQGSGSGWSQGR